MSNLEEAKQYLSTLELEDSGEEEADLQPAIDKLTGLALSPVETVQALAEFAKRDMRALELLRNIVWESDEEVAEVFTSGDETLIEAYRTLRANMTQASLDTSFEETLGDVAMQLGFNAEEIAQSGDEITAESLMAVVAKISAALSSGEVPESERSELIPEVLGGVRKSVTAATIYEDLYA